jgi:hypothetical protein
MDVGNLGSLGASRNAALLRLLGTDDGNSDEIIKALTEQPRFDAQLKVAALALQMMQEPGLPTSVSNTIDLTGGASGAASAQTMAAMAQANLTARVADIYRMYGSPGG